MRLSTRNLWNERKLVQCVVNNNVYMQRASILWRTTGCGLHERFS
jgi:hypothetical protein